MSSDLDREHTSEFCGRVNDRLSLGKSMILIAGAAFGLGLLPLGAATHQPVFGPSGISWQGMIITFYGALSGITMAAFCLLVADRMRCRRPWGPAAVSLFAAGFTAWLFLPMVAAAWVVASGVFEPFSFFRHIFVAHNMGAYAYEAFYHFWPVACLALFVGCNLSGQARRWWAFEGWWAEWLGMWVLVNWTVPAIPILAAFLQTYFRR
jgi:hypothetical protein